jgi:hypothetical protein
MSNMRLLKYVERVILKLFQDLITLGEKRDAESNS